MTGQARSVTGSATPSATSTSSVSGTVAYIPPSATREEHRPGARRGGPFVEVRRGGAGERRTKDEQRDRPGGKAARAVGEEHATRQGQERADERAAPDVCAEAPGTPSAASPTTTTPGT